MCPRNIVEGNIGLHVHEKYFCSIRKSQNISFNQVIKDELKQNFEVVDNVISDKHVESFIKYENKHKRVQSQLTNMINYDIEPFNTNKCVPYSNCIYKLSRVSGKNYRHITEQEYEKCRKHSIVFKGLDYFNKLLAYVLQFKGKAKRINNNNNNI